MNKPNNQQGFSVMALIVIIVVLAALAFGGWYVWKNNKDDATNTNDTEQQGQNQNTQNNNQQESNDPTENGKYLVIKEWGVRFELPEELRGSVKYGIEKSDDKQIAWFEISNLAAMQGSECKLVQTTEAGHSGLRGGIGVFLERTTTAVPDNQTPYYYAPATNMNIDDYWFSGGRERYSESCINDTSKEQLVEDTRTPLIYALELLAVSPE